MGNSIGSISRRVVALATKPFKNYNIEGRAHKEISKDKPKVAPRHKSDEIDYKRIMKEYPGAYQESLQKHEELDKHLRSVYVDSHDPNTEELKPDPNRPLPLNRKPVEEFDYGIKEPDQIPLGKASLRQALTFITEHQADPKVNSCEKIAVDYKVPENTIRDILKHFKVYQIYLPEQRKTKAKFAGPSVPKITITTHPRRVLGAGAKNEK